MNGLKEYPPLPSHEPPLPPTRSGPCVLQKSDVINHPSHYTAGRIECIDAIKSAVCELKGVEAVCTGNAIKYLWRWKQKNGVEDLKKAIWYINKLIEEA